MKWNNMRRSDNVEDERNDSSGSGSGSPTGALSIGGVVIAVIAGLVLQVNPLVILGFLQSSNTDTGAPTSKKLAPPVNDRDSDFVKAILGDTEDTWSKIFQQQLNTQYQPPKLVLFRSSVNSACGSAQTSSGPFYCPADKKVYLDMAFFQYLEATAGENADFARSYVIAHEGGHHVQNLLGTSGEVRQLKSGASKAKANELSVRVELQADCLAGVWGFNSAQRGLIDRKDVSTALNTATQIGDDYLQKQAKRNVVPESFTHGTSQQRVNWFTRGLKSGDIDQCDTFKTNRL